MTATFAAGDVCLLLGSRDRRFLIDLKDGGSFEYHAGSVLHEAIIGNPVGTVVRTSSGARLVAVRPRLADFILKMKRGAQVVYPKDMGPILAWGDIHPGLTVLEAGTGSGALTMALARVVGASGRVVSVERRDDHASHARSIIERFFGEVPPWVELRTGEVEDHVAEVAPDRIVLDLPEPWSVVAPAASGMAPGGVFTAYVPTVPQLQRLHDELRRSKRFAGIEGFEVMQRQWLAEGRSVRPQSMMVGHTGFITVAYRTEAEMDADDPATEDGVDE